MNDIGGMIGGVVRAILAAVAGYIVGAGVIDAGTADTVIGALMALFTAGWSMWAKNASKKAAVIATDVAVNKAVNEVTR